MAIRIITDSTADFTPEEIKSCGIEIVPLKVIFGQQEYLDGITITKEEFYEKLIHGGVFPTTSQPTPNDFIELFEEAKAVGDEVLVFLISSKLSGTYQSALLAKDYLDYSPIYLVDTYSASIGIKILVQYALKLRDENKTATEIYEIIEKEKSRISIKAVVDTLEFLVKGGRLSKVAGFAGSLLSVKPLIEVPGEVKLFGKVRGKKAALEALYKAILKDGGIDLSLPVLLGYTAENSLAIELKQYLEEHGIHVEDMVGIGSVIGTHAGPNACAISYFRK